MSNKVRDHGERRSVLREEIKNKSHCRLHFFIRVDDDLARRVVNQPNGQAKAQLTFLSLGQLAAQHPLAYPVKFSFTHRSTKAEEQPIIILTWIIDAFLIDDKRLGQSTDLQQAIRVTAGTSQP